MKYDNPPNDGEYRVGTCSISCAFGELRDSFTARVHGGYHDFWSGHYKPLVRETEEEFHTRLWYLLCAAIREAEKRPVLIPTTDREPVMRDLIAACPYFDLVAEQKSRHGRYMVQLWIAQVHPKGKVRA